MVHTLDVSIEESRSQKIRCFLSVSVCVCMVYVWAVLNTPDLLYWIRFMGLLKDRTSKVFQKIYLVISYSTSYVLCLIPPGRVVSTVFLFWDKHSKKE